MLCFTYTEELSKRPVEHYDCTMRILWKMSYSNTVKNVL
jgi:hypothetical protein